MADTFAKAKLELLGRVMHDAALTASARIVFYEILDHVNRVSGDAWPAETTIAKRLGLEVRTVRRALYGFTTKGKKGKPDTVNVGLVQRGYITIEIDGRSNSYRPVFDQPGGTPDNLTGVHQRAPGAHQRAPHVGTPDKNAGNTGQIVHGTPDKNVPLTFLREPTQDNLLKTTNINLSALSRAREGSETAQRDTRGAVLGQPRKGVGDDDPIASRTDDGGVHLLLIQELGSDVVDALYQTDSGRPLKMLTAARRQRALTPIEVNHARQLVAGDLRRGGGGR